MRLAKYLAQSGVASRRHAEDLIRAGQVTVNGTVVTEVVTLVDPKTDSIKVGNRRLYAEPLFYVLLNKPAGYISTAHDPQGRPTVIELTADLPVRLHPVGRLDFDTEGLLLLTNDGEFTNLVTHPRYQIDKKYLVKVKGYVTDEEAAHLQQGVEVEDGMTAPAIIKLRNRNQMFTEMEITIHEGRKRQVKRMCAAVGHPVVNLTRTGLGFLELGPLKTGEYRLLSSDEVEGIKMAAWG
ncbi:MAG: rRNA pseudouridine synthase [Syntrophomonadaceae bacterium]|nr:rRNA pseudouridine synthase [Syntrophomonadaceae bacterium]